MRTLSLTLPEALEARLQEVARRRGVSKSALVREALMRFLEDGFEGWRPSVLDLAGDLCGCLEGPGDLSTDKRHMKDFGR